MTHVAVVGAGVMGCAAAWALHEGGADVTVYEQFDLDNTRGSSHGRSRIFRLAYPDPAAVSQTIARIRVVDLPTLIQLKLAARRYQDFADVVSLIRANDLHETFALQLHTSVRRDFIECLEAKRREDEYEERNA